MQLNRKVRPDILNSVALLVIDAQDKLLDAISNKEEFKKRAAFAIEAARCLNVQTLFTEQAPERLGHTNGQLLKLARDPKVFSKQSFSALGAPGIERYLREKEIYNLLVVGIETPVCVYQTGLQATDEDIDITFLSDCLGSRRPQDDAPTLSALTRMGCQVLPSETIFYSLLSDAQNPYFRAFTEVVKAFGNQNFSLESYLANRPSEGKKKQERPASNSNAAPDRKRGRRRDRAKGPDSQETQPGADGSSDNRRPQPEQGNKPENRQKQRRPRKPKSVERSPAPASEQTKPKSEQKENSSAPPQPPKKRPAAKKAAKKAVKRVAKKTARKTAKKKPTEPSAD